MSDQNPYQTQPTEQYPPQQYQQQYQQPNEPAHQPAYPQQYQPQPPAGSLDPYAVPKHDPNAAPTNTLAIVALVLGLTVPIGGIVLGHIALSQIRRTGEAGHGLALAGLIIGYAYTALVFLAIIAYIVFIVAIFGIAGFAGMSGVGHSSAGYSA
ncbi:DUF4190 domain-containing protein [Subtercola sp. Z020]|uniref:DUF4190 domain-containing protein n=1 Tax=Subtercola sp. Z020 TaxID=2080582 RepID=UPI000CE86CD8|nr:DUF4190 domain-containing protein [Subtercola sp. Z020]PPF77415.1 DUF4190 domain-containing protein [Subtercola sp. Z020]